jgi:hypothetical protein
MKEFAFMSNRVLVVESNPHDFERWTNPDYGVGAQLEALGGDGESAVVERIDTPADLFEVATEVKNSEHLPARAVVFSGVQGSDLARNPIDAFWMKDKIEAPADYDERRDPIWVWRGLENRPLSPYGRLIGSRLVQRALPDVDYYPDDGIYENWEQKYTDIFHWAYAGMGFDELRATYGGFLARVNKSLAVTGKDFMALVDTMGEKPYGSTSPIEGADIDLHLAIGLKPLEGIEEPRDYRGYQAVRQIGVVAKLLKGDYPGATSAFDDINFILPRREPVEA